MSAAVAEAERDAPIPLPRRRIDWTPWLIACPVLVVYVLFFAVPLLILFANSVERWAPATDRVIDAFTLFQYERYLFDEYYIEVFLRTLRVGLVTTLVCVILAYPVAIHLTKAGPRERGLLTLIIISPLLVSVVILCFGWLIVFAPKGVINYVLLALGIIDAPLPIKFSEASVVIGLAHVYFPFAALAIYNSLQTIDPAVVRAASVLGAGPVRIFWNITLPLSVPGALAGSLIVFALSISAFVTPMFLGGAWVKVVAYNIWEQNMVLIDWPFGAAISVVLLVVTASIMIGYNRLMERRLFAGVFHR